VTRTSSQDDATVKCWGWNLYGQLGYGDTSRRGDGSNGARPSRGCGGREEEWSRWLTVVPCRRDGGEASCSRSGVWEEGGAFGACGVCRLSRGELLHGTRQPELHALPPRGLCNVVGECSVHAVFCWALLDWSRGCKLYHVHAVPRRQLLSSEV